MLHNFLDFFNFIGLSFGCLWPVVLKLLAFFRLVALIESDAEGIGGSGFVECIREHIHSVILMIFHILQYVVQLLGA